MNLTSFSSRIALLMFAAGTIRCSDSGNDNPIDAGREGSTDGEQDSQADAEQDGTVDCGALPASVEQRLETMRGPLGCAPTQTVVPDPPGGCTGTDQLLSEVRLAYGQLWGEGGCRNNPASLSPVVTAYNEAFSSQHVFVKHAVPRDAYSISVREFGAEHAGEGPTIILMHGFPDNQHLYDSVAPALGETFQTITFDFVGWGDSTKPPADYVFTYEALRQDLEAVLSYFALTAVVPVVHDASGWPGIDWALDHPDSVTALVLLNTVYHPIPGTAPPNVIRALSALDLRPTYLDAIGTDDLMTRAVFHAQVSRFFDDPSARRAVLPLLENDASSIRPGVFGLTEKLVDALIARLSNVQRMQTFPRPVVVAFGADDPTLNTEVAQGFASAFAQSRLELVENAGHYVQLDQPDRVVSIIQAAAQGR
jgi:haloalkane dehalogenase